MPNKNVLIIEDHFFSIIRNGEDYLKPKYIPEKVRFCSTPFSVEDNIPVIYGLPEVVITKEDQIIVHCRIDIFSSIFFMVTRWEEYVIPEKDRHNRFPEKFSLSVRNGIYRRPVVNEYIEMIWKMLLYIGFSGPRRSVKFEAIITHDTDEILRYKSLLKFLRILSGDILLRKKPGLIPSTVNKYLSFKLGKIKDSFDTFDYLMDLSESVNTKSHFYFLSQRPGRKGFDRSHDFRYDIFSPIVVSVIRNIQRRGHYVGMHGSYNSFNDPELFKEELQNLQKIAGDVSECRQHYLRISLPFTWEIENQNNIKTDSTLGFVDEFGFRSGICSPYQVFDFLNRKPLNLVELPLTFMDGAFMSLPEDPEKIFTEVCSIIDLVKKYQGKFVMLWHTNSFNVFEWQLYEKYYPKIIEYLGFRT